MTDCPQAQTKTTDTHALPSLPDSCNYLVGAYGYQFTPTLKLRSDAPQATQTAQAAQEAPEGQEAQATPGTQRTQRAQEGQPAQDTQSAQATKSSGSNENPPDAPNSRLPCDPCQDSPNESHKTPSLKAPAKFNFWFNGGLLSYHPTDHSHQYNDVNYGFGVEIEKSRVWAGALGEYRNSVRHNSYYGMVEYRPLHLGPVNAGIAAGTIDGYPAMRNGKFFPAAMPVVSFEKKHLGANLIYIPDVVKGVVPALSMQVKLKF